MFSKQSRQMQYCTEHFIAMETGWGEKKGKTLPVSFFSKILQCFTISRNSSEQLTDTTVKILGKQQDGIIYPELASGPNDIYMTVFVTHNVANFDHICF